MAHELSCRRRRGKQLPAVWVAMALLPEVRAAWLAAMLRLLVLTVACGARHRRQCREA